MNLDGKLEAVAAAFIAAIAGRPAGHAVMKGHDQEEKVYPCTICYSRGGPEEPLGSGNRLIRLTFINQSDAERDDALDDPLKAHNDLNELIFGALKIDDLAAQLNAKAAELGIDITVFDPIEDVGSDPELAGRAFQDDLNLQMYVANCTIS